jgi:nicotinate dehydrogenase subunit A
MPERFKLRVNGREHEVSAEPKTPLLYILRNDLKLKGTRFGCGVGQCGACTVLVDGNAVQSCDTPLWSAAGREITTVESPQLDALRESFIEEQAAQCGYCINGIMMAAAALLQKEKDPSHEQIVAALDRNLCRCGTHVRILRAIKRTAQKAAPNAAGRPQGQSQA